MCERERARARISTDYSGRAAHTEEVQREVPGAAIGGKALHRVTPQGRDALADGGVDPVPLEEVKQRQVVLGRSVVLLRV